MESIKWIDFFGQENLLIEGKGDDVFHVIPTKYDDEGNSYTRILSKKALIEFAEKSQEVTKNATYRKGVKIWIDMMKYCQ